MKEISFNLYHSMFQLLNIFDFGNLLHTDIYYYSVTWHIYNIAAE